MAPSSDSGSGIGNAQLLRRELCFRNLEYAHSLGLRHSLSYGEVPVVAYEPDDAETAHGNFLPETYRAIVAHALWRKRLEKAHSQARTSLPRNQRGCWKELDSCTSSDALLMNVFCYPGTLASDRVYSMLGEEAGKEPEFGVKARVPLCGGRFDRTEVDMRLGHLLVEAKLTETDFQSKSIAVVHTYRDFAEVFARRDLPRVEDRYLGYQLIRNVLAAHAGGCSCCVLLDARRPDLLEAWYKVMRCVKPVGLRLRLKALTWQELSEVLPQELRRFLGRKYGIFSAGSPTCADSPPQVFPQLSSAHSAL